MREGGQINIAVFFILVLLTLFFWERGAGKIWLDLKKSIHLGA